MNIRNFFIVSFSIHFGILFLLYAWQIPMQQKRTAEREPIIARLILPQEISPPLSKQRPAIPARPIPPGAHKELPKTMKGGIQLKKGKSIGPADKGREIVEEANGDTLQLAEKRAIEKVLKGLEPEKHENGDGGEDELTFSTGEFKYYGYKMRLKEKIEGIWEYPRQAAEQGIYADLYIRFTILKNGDLGAVELLRTSGYKMMDDAALKALRDAVPYWPLPDEWKENSFTITGHFIYSLHGYYLR